MKFMIKKKAIFILMMVSLWYNKNIQIESCGGEMNMMMFLKLRNI